jgi:pyruvate/2-oxoglutarate dehydrogenase complex dihydrolipoamide dehydrogenase (E3) component
VPGLAEAGYLTSENVFELERAPGSLVIIGGGPIGVELAQALNRLGVRVTLLQRGPRILPRDEPQLAGMLAAKLRAEGVDLRLEARPERVEAKDGRKLVHARTGDGEQTWAADQVLVAVGRRPNIEPLALERAGIESDRRGILVDTRLRTTAKWVYAAGDCAGRYLFTHAAAAEAVVALRNMFYPGSAKAPGLVPWATFTDPELAHAGLTSDEAARRIGADKVRVYEWDMSHSDRARADGSGEGRIVVVTDSRFRILGAHVLAPAAGEIISQFTLAIQQGLRITPALGNMVQVYPTYSTSVAQAAAEATYGQLQRPFLRAMRRLNAAFGGG